MAVQKGGGPSKEAQRHKETQHSPGRDHSPHVVHRLSQSEASDGCGVGIPESGAVLEQLGQEEREQSSGGKRRRVQ